MPYYERYKVHNKFGKITVFNFNMQEIRKLF